MAPRSKRQRKQKDRISLKGKQRALGQDGMDDDTVIDPNAVILPSNPDADQAGANDASPSAPPAPRLSKSQQRKLRKVQEEKERRGKRADVMAVLSKHQMQGDQLGLLRPVSALGQKDSKKAALRRALQLQRAGIDVPSDVQLYKERGNPEEDGGSDSSEEEEEDVGRSGAIKSAPKGFQAQKKAPAKPEQESSDDDDSDAFSGDEGEEEVLPSAKRLKKSDDGVAAKKATAASAAVAAAQLRQAVDQAKSELGDVLMRDDDDDEEGGGLISGKFPSRSLLGQPPNAPPRVVLVQRKPEIEAVRTNLPIVGMEQEIMEAISENDVIVLCGETGCGKTTQVPQFLYEAGYGNKMFPERAGAIGVTQPRRVAAVSTAGRVADELGSKLGDLVRYDKRLGPSTSLKFMTDGILLRELQEDFLLRKYSAILVDEAHERSLNTDILLGMLSRIVTLRRSMAAGAAGGGDVHPLKLIIMSATLRIEDFVGNRRLFPSPPPLVSVPARQYPVTVHFSRRTELHDYVGAAFKKVSQIHKNLPPGAILVFLTGQREVEYLCRKLRQSLGPKQRRAKGKQGAADSGADKDVQQENISGLSDLAGEVPEEDGKESGGWGAGGGGDEAEADAGADADEALLLAALEDERTGGADRDDFDDVDGSDDEDKDEDEVVILGGEGFTPEQIAEAEQRFNEQLGVPGSSNNSLKKDGGEDEEMPVLVLPLYAMLPPAQQAKVFRSAPPGTRLIIVATNVAETSLTIPGVRYVVDAGRSKQRLLENAAGLARFEVRWVSKASAEQRAGRAGRTGPGHCYRIYSSAHFNDTFPQHSPPEIANTALEGVALSLKALGVDKVTNFPFPSAPEPAALKAAEQCLVSLGALDPATGRLTPLGVAMAKYPVSPRHARMLLEAMRGAETAAEGLLDEEETGKKKKKKEKRSQVTAEEVLRYAVGLAAVLSVESPFINISNIGQTGASGRGEEEDEDHKLSKEEMAREEATKKERQFAHAAHAQLRVPESDALSALCALCAFEAAGESEAFCRSNFLLYKNLREAAALRKQLSRLVSAQRGNPGPGSTTLQLSDHTPPAAPPPQAALEALRRAVAAGWGDQVARRVRSLEHVQGQGGSGKKGRAVRYRSCAILDEDIFLHPNSALHKSAPDFVVYTEIVRTVKRPYMAGLTAVEARWLPTAATPLCSFSAPLLDPQPYYSPAADAVMCWQDVTFGAHQWPLPRHAARHPEASERCAVFAAALLEGKVLAGMAALRPAMAVPPSMAAKPEMRVHRRVADFISALEKKEVDSKAALAAAWKKDSNFLKVELGEWMQKGAAGKVQAAWPGLLVECLGK